MERRRNLCFLFVVTIFVLAGCATNRGVLGLQVPAESMTNPTGKQVYIRSIADNRQFQDNPPSADIPSLGFGGLDKLTPELKSRAIARKRNTYGKALGDIVLEEGQTVQEVINKATRNALYSLGYVVIDKQGEARPDAIIVDISIEKFWAWMTPGFWSLSLKSEMSTVNTIQVPKRDNPIIIKAAAANSCQVASEANWKKVFRMAIDDFIEKAKTELKHLDANH